MSKSKLTLVRQLLAGLALMSVTACGSQPEEKPTAFYVSPDGKDSNAGTEATPFATLEKARDAVRAGGAKTVYLKGGTYKLTKTFELNENDSNTTYKAATGEAVRIIGGCEIYGSAVKPVTDTAILNRIIEKSARAKIKQIKLKALGITNYGELGPRGFRRAYIPAPMELFIDGQAQSIARWPNEGEKHIPMGKVIKAGSRPRNGDYSFKVGSFKYGVDRPKKWLAARDMYISGLFCYGYADDTIKVAKIDTKEGTFTTTHPHLYGFGRRSFCGWQAMNLLEEIDQPGEYFIEKTSGILYLYPPTTFTPRSKLYVSQLTEVMVAIEGARNICLENITFEMTRGSGVYIERGSGNTIAGCTLRNMGTIAVQIGKGIKPFPYGKHDGCGNKADGKLGIPTSRIMGNWHEHIYKYTAWNREAGTNHKVLSCDIYDIGAGGIMLGGGDRRTLTPGNTLVKNCDIYRVNRWDRTYKAPVNVDGCGNKIINNHLHHCPGLGVYLHGNDHVIEYNEIDHVLTDMSDMGAIYMGRDPSETGNSFSYNFFHNIKNYHNGGHGVQAIFFDDCSFGAAKMTCNVFYKAGSNKSIFFNGGGGCEIRNNMFIDCNKTIDARNNTGRCRSFMKGKLGHERLRTRVDVTKPPYSTKYPKLLAAYLHKIAIGVKPADNYVVKGDLSQFIDGENMNFQLKKDSEVYKRIPKFKEVPFGEMGLFVDKYRLSLSKASKE